MSDNEKDIEYGKREAYLKWGNPARPNDKTYTWNELTELVGKSRVAIRSAARYYRSKHPDEFKSYDGPELIELVGVTAEEHEPDEDLVYERAVQDFAEKQEFYERKRNQIIRFDSGPIAIVYAADHHFGDPGVDVERAFREAELIANTPGMWMGSGGDMANNMVIGSLRQARDFARSSIPDQWALLRKYLRLIMPKHLFSIPGNHVGWNTLLTGVDYFQEILESMNDRSFYDPYVVTFKIVVGDWEIPCKARHKWRGNSMYNVTHAIERAAQREGDFLMGFGAHTHTGGYARHINVGGHNGVAVQAGTYKMYDDYAMRMGFEKPNESTAVAVVLNEQHHSFTCYDNLEACADDMLSYYE